MTPKQRTSAISVMDAYLGFSQADKALRIHTTIIANREQAKWFPGFEKLAKSELGLDMMDILINVTVEKCHQGADHIGTRYVMEIIRGHSRLREKGLFKLNNNYFRSWIVLLKCLIPETEGLYELRR